MTTKGNKLTEQHGQSEEILFLLYIYQESTEPGGIKLYKKKMLKTHHTIKKIELEILIKKTLNFQSIPENVLH